MICRILKVSAGRSEHCGAPPHGAQPPRGAPSTNCNLWVLHGRISAHFFYQINSPVHVGPCQSGRLPSATTLSYIISMWERRRRRWRWRMLVSCYSPIAGIGNQQNGGANAWAWLIRYICLHGVLDSRRLCGVTIAKQNIHKDTETQ